MSEKFIVGWREFISLPGIQLEGIKAKVDTGAKTSALHAEKLECQSNENGDTVEFVTYNKDAVEHQVTAPLHEMRLVKDSHGNQSERPVIITDLLLNGMSWPIEITLISRDDMTYPMLLGRQAIRGLCLVDPKLSYVTRKKLQ